MKQNQLTLLFFGLFFLIVSQLEAQQKYIHGVVTTFDSIAVIGAEVQLKSTKQIVKSDSLGKFSIAVTGPDKLKVMAKGFNTTNVKLGENTKLVAVNLKLKAGAKAREYAVGYGHVSDANKLNAVSQMRSGDINFSQYTSMHELIRGRFAGVQVQSNGDIIIRGVNSINSSSAALIIVDGIPVDKSAMYSLVPANVASINILKDGSAAIYGSRGANGVVLIETKSGAEN